jgi:beta-lactamase regulating signal transducer with metallopeptidase domain
MAWYLSWIALSLLVAGVAGALGGLAPRAGRVAVRHVAWWAAAAVVAGLPPAGAWLWSAGAAPSAFHAASMAGGGAVAAPVVVVPAVMPGVAAAFLVLWAAGTLWAIARLARDVYRLRRLRAACVPMTPGERRRFVRTEAANRGWRRATLAWCVGVDRPVMLGLGRPILALPPMYGLALSDADLDRVLLHELAHARRCDDLARVIERAWLAACWVNPVAHLVVSRLVVTREMACDDWAVAHDGDAATYIRTLASVARLGRGPAPRWLPAAATGSRGALSRRARRVLAAGYRPRAGASAPALAGVPVLLAGLAIGIAQMPPVFVDEVGASTNQSPVVGERAVPAAVVTVVTPLASGAQGGVASRQPAAPTDQAAVRPGSPGAAPGAMAEPVLPMPSFVPDVLSSPVEPPPDGAAATLASTGLPIAGPAALAAPPVAADLGSAREADSRWWGSVATAARSTASAFGRLGAAVSGPFNR